MPEEFQRSKSVEDQKKDLLRERQKAYKITFGGRGATTKIIMDDLRKFCFAEESCFNPDNNRVNELFEGRRQVWLRIKKHLDLEEEELFLRYEKGVR